MSDSETKSSKSSFFRKLTKKFINSSPGKSSSTNLDGADNTIPRSSNAEQASAPILGTSGDDDFSGSTFSARYAAVKSVDGHLNQKSDTKPFTDRLTNNDANATSHIPVVFRSDQSVRSQPILASGSSKSSIGLKEDSALPTDSKSEILKMKPILKKNATNSGEIKDDLQRIPANTEATTKINSNPSLPTNLNGSSADNLPEKKIKKQVKIHSEKSNLDGGSRDSNSNHSNSVASLQKVSQQSMGEDIGNNLSMESMKNTKSTENQVTTDILPDSTNNSLPASDTTTSSGSDAIVKKKKKKPIAKSQDDGSEGHCRENSEMSQQSSGSNIPSNSDGQQMDCTTSQTEDSASVPKKKKKKKSAPASSQSIENLGDSQVSGLSDDPVPSKGNSVVETERFSSSKASIAFPTGQVEDRATAMQILGMNTVRSTRALTLDSSESNGSRDIIPTSRSVISRPPMSVTSHAASEFSDKSLRSSVSSNSYQGFDTHTPEDLLSKLRNNAAKGPSLNSMDSKPEKPRLNIKDQRSSRGSETGSFSERTATTSPLSGSPTRTFSVQSPRKLTISQPGVARIPTASTISPFNNPPKKPTLKSPFQNNQSSSPVINTSPQSITLSRLRTGSVLNQKKAMQGTSPLTPNSNMISPRTQSPLMASIDSVDTNEESNSDPNHISSNPFIVPGNPHLVQCFPNNDGLFVLQQGWDTVGKFF
jgi:hypothetical protein